MNHEYVMKPTVNLLNAIAQGSSPHDIQKKLLQEFEQNLKKGASFKVTSQCSSNAPALGYFFAPRRVYVPIEQVHALREWSNERQSGLYSVHDAKAKLVAFWYAKTGALWVLASSALKNKKQASKLLKEADFAGLSNWCLPTLAELHDLPLDFVQDLSKEGFLHFTQGIFDVQNQCARADNQASVLAICRDFKFTLRNKESRLASFIAYLGVNQYRLSTFQCRVEQAADVGVIEAFQKLVPQGSILFSTSSHFYLNRKDYMLNADQYKLVDFTPCRLPELKPAELSDPNAGGLWELYHPDASNEAALRAAGLAARDPKLDVRTNRAVTIDFGTSSTVVAYRDESGQDHLLRMGLPDFFAKPEPHHYENPTVLQCKNWGMFAKVWQTQSYRPALDWDWMLSSHEAATNLRDKINDFSVLSSMLPRIKQWALRDEHDPRVLLSDPLGHHMRLPLLEHRTVVRNALLTVSEQDPFDPVELYAWYLGMNINRRVRGKDGGLYLKYYMSFPVAYPKATKEKILASFTRGLLRSLPETLVRHYNEILNQFEVKELTSEPTAYATAALKQGEVELTSEGVPYAVFDFGGGTSDFDYGLMRWANEDEDALGYESAIDALHNAGDNFLGGENLIDHMAYQCFRDNLELLRENRITFTAPMRAQRFAGSEAFLRDTMPAQVNTLTLTSKLRRFMVEGEIDEELDLELFDEDNNKQRCTLQINAAKLDELLFSKMRSGVELFLKELARVHDKFPEGAPIHILLAGNGSRSRHIQALFDQKGQYWPQLIQAAFGCEVQQPDLHGQAQRIAQAISEDVGTVAHIWRRLNQASAPSVSEVAAELGVDDMLVLMVQRKGQQLSADVDSGNSALPTFIIHQPLPMNTAQPDAPTTKTGVALGMLHLVPGGGVKLNNHVLSQNEGEAPFAWFVGRGFQGKFTLALEPNVPYGQWAQVARAPEGGLALIYYTASVRAKDGMGLKDPDLSLQRLSFANAPDGAKVWARAVGPNQIELVATDKDVQAISDEHVRDVQTLTLKQN